MTLSKTDLTQEQVLSLFTYDKATGKLYHKKSLKRDKAPRISNSTGVTGVSPIKGTTKYRAYIRPAGEAPIALGRFNSIDEALAARKKFQEENPNLFLPHNAEAGYTQNEGYRQVRVGDKIYMTHRIIWLMEYGTHPEQIDHIDHDRSNNRLENLRDVPQWKNQHNTILRVDNTSGVKGVFYNKGMDRWQVRIQVNNTSIHLGTFDSFESATLARENAEKQLNAAGV
jgi:hypothetical protein